MKAYGLAGDVPPGGIATMPRVNRPRTGGVHGGAAERKPPPPPDTVKRQEEGE